MKEEIICETQDDVYLLALGKYTCNKISAENLAKKIYYAMLSANEITNDLAARFMSYTANSPGHSLRLQDVLNECYERITDAHNDYERLLLVVEKANEYADQCSRPKLIPFMNKNTGGLQEIR